MSTYKHSNDDALDLGWTVIMVGLIIGAIIVIAAIIPLANNIIAGPNGNNTVSGVNYQISQGKMSQKGADYFTFWSSSFIWIPAFALLGGILYIAYRAYFVKRTGG
jgi:hypothetical protein